MKDFLHSRPEIHESDPEARPREKTETNVPTVLLLRLAAPTNLCAVSLQGCDRLFQYDVPA